MKKPVAYRISPVFPVEEGGIATAALITCLATGEILSGHGGGGEFLSPSVVGALKNNGESRVICDSAIYEEMVDLARRAAEGEDVSASARQVMEKVKNRNGV